MLEDIIFNVVVGTGLVLFVIAFSWLATVILCVIAHYIPATRPAIKKILNPDFTEH